MKTFVNHVESTTMTEKQTFATTLEHLPTQQEQALGDLARLVSIPSISTDPARKADLQRAADMLEEILLSKGFTKTSQLPTSGNPVIYGEWMQNPAAPTILFYGHYDVQPVDPLELWETDPFTMVIAGDHAFGRGVSDMKGQTMAFIAAAAAAIAAGNCPVNIKVLAEGEEEIGSPHFREALLHNKDLLKCDVVVNVDAGMASADVPALVYGLRGLVFFEIRLRGPERDLHSGSFGGIVHNPAIALCDLISRMHDSSGKVALPGFYDQVAPLNAQERERLNFLALDDAEYLAQTGAPTLWGEAGYTAVERIGARPTLEVNGMVSGFTGQGGKTIIPAEASAKISCRLVPDQDPATIYQAMEQFISQNVPSDITWSLNPFRGGGAAVLTDPDTPHARKLAAALETTWNHPVAYRREGGSINVVTDMKEILGADTILSGFGLPDDRIHSPNERLHLPTWRRGSEALLRYLFSYGDQP